MSSHEYEYSVNADGPWLDIVLKKEPPKKVTDEIIRRLKKFERACLIETDEETYLEIMHPVVKYVGLLGTPAEEYVIVMKYSIEAGKCVCKDCTKLEKQEKSHGEW